MQKHFDKNGISLDQTVELNLSKKFGNVFNLICDPKIEPIEAFTHDIATLIK